MRKTRLLVGALFALLALGAVIASAASAEVPPILCVNDSTNVEPKYLTQADCENMTNAMAEGEWALGWEWLVEGKELAAETAAETEGSLTLKQFSASKGTSVLTEVLCEGIFDGFIGPGRLDRIVDLLNTNMELIEELADNANARALSCTVTFDAGASTDCAAGSLAEVWPLHLSLELELDWDTEIVVGAGGEPLDLFTALEKGGASAAQPGYEVRCESLFLGVKGEEECEGGVVAASLENDLTTTPVSVLGKFNAVAVSERANCKAGGVESAENVGEGHTWAIGAELERLETAIS